MRLVGIDALWIVPEGHPVVFNITKKHIHNVLQGVSQHGETLGPTEISYFEAWTLANWQAFWRDSGIFDDRLVVIDDPQLSELIPLIKEKNPDTKIIFRSHIRIQSSLTDKEGTPQHQVAEYLWNCVKQSDLYVAHPVKNFVPACIKEGKMPVLYM
jgi:alpha,alpha-trehalose phosphorylase (configuration-retaining)